MQANSPLAESAESKPVFSEDLVCHHATNTNPEALKGFALSMLKAEGYCTDANREIEEELLSGKQIVLTTISNTAHTGLSIVTTKLPIKYKNRNLSESDQESSNVNVFITASVSDKSTEAYQRLQAKISQWNEDPYLMDRISEASIDDIRTSIRGQTLLPKASGEYTSYSFIVAGSHRMMNHYAAKCVLLFKTLNSDIELRNKTLDTPFVNAKSITKLLTLGMNLYHEMELRVQGKDTERTLKYLERIGREIEMKQMAIQKESPRETEEGSME